MSDKNLVVAPPRLLEGDDEIGRVLRERQELWEATQRRAQPSRAQFAALTAKRDRKAHLRSGLGMSAAAVALLGLTTLGHWLVQPNADQQLVATPDLMHVSMPSPKPPSHEAQTGVTELTQRGLGAGQVAPSYDPAASGAPALVLPNPLSTGVGMSRGAVPSNAVPSNAVPSNAVPSNAVPSNHTEAAGAAHARSGQLTIATKAAGPTAPQMLAHPSQDLPRQDCRRLNYVDARACYTRQSEGSGITAELSYLERARLEQQQGGDPAAALRSLNEYQRRFPHGTLQPEATLARIRLLVSSHQNREAREAIAQALPKMPEKAAVLREVALDLAVAAGDCAQATQLLQQIPAEVATTTWKTAHLGRCAAIDR